MSSLHRPSASDKENVYFIQGGDGLIKIGKTKRLLARMTAIRNARPDGITLLGICANVNGLEKRLHSKFGHARVGGEWFSPCAELLRWISDNAEDFCPVSNVPKAKDEFLSKAEEISGIILDRIQVEFGCNRRSAIKTASERSGLPAGWFERITGGRMASVYAADLDTLTKFFIADSERLIALISVEIEATKGRIAERDRKSAAALLSEARGLLAVPKEALS